MADNVSFQNKILATPPASTVVAADKIDDVAYQRMKLVIGKDGEAIGDVSTEIPLPVTMEAANQILTELRIMNMHLAIITDNTITEEDI